MPRAVLSKGDASFSSKLLVSRQIDVILAGLLALLSVALELSFSFSWAVGVDLLAVGLALLAAWWPRIGGIGLGLVLLGCLWLPQGYAAMAEYAPIIPILTSGMRGQRRRRFWFSIGFGLVLAALTYRSAPSVLSFLLGSLIWTVFIAFLWVIGNLFTAYRQAHTEAEAYNALQGRLAIARGLHDTTARSLARVLLTAERATVEGHGSPALDQAMAGVRQATSELRAALAALRSATQMDTLGSDGSLVTAIESARSMLDSAGISSQVHVDGDIEALPLAVKETVTAVLNETVANVERHGLASEPCSIRLSATSSAVDLAIMNEIDASLSNDEKPQKLGLVGLSERVSAHGGKLTAEREGSTWLTQVTIPVER